MDFLNLNFVEFFTLAGLASAAIVALYLMDRSKRRQLVATLRFWSAGHTPEELKHKRRIHQPWSLLLQLISVLLLLAAIAEPFWGSRSSTRDHVLLLDTSAWMAARARQGTLLDQAKASALAYLNSLPSGDRVMLVRVDALPTPVTQFETNRTATAAAIQQSQASTSILDLEQALEFAQRAQKLQSHTAGEIVFAGAARIAHQEGDTIEPPPNFRFLAIPSNGENVGIRKLALRRATETVPDPKNPAKTPAASPDAWEVFIGLRNDGTRPREVALEVQFASSPIGSKTITVVPGTETQETFTFHAKTGGLVEARIRSTNGRADAFAQDDRAAIELPVAKTLRVMAYTNEPDLLKPLLSEKEHLETTFAAPAAYLPKPAADMMILDRFSGKDLAKGMPQIPAVWIEPGAGSPFALRSSATNVKLERWDNDSPLAAGLSTKDIRLATTAVLAPMAGDQAVAEVAAGPVILTRPAPVKAVALGFDPLRSAMKYDLATPLLVANILRWIAPDTFRRSDVQAGSVGTVDVPIEPGVTSASIRVLDANQRPLPFTIENGQLRFFSGAPGNVRVVIGDRETVYSLTLSDVGDVAWNPPTKVARGIPQNGLASSSPPTLWPWLALLGAIGLCADWWLYGRKRIIRLKARTLANETSSSQWRKAS